MFKKLPFLILSVALACSGVGAVEEPADLHVLRELEATGNYRRGTPQRAKFSPDGKRLFFLRSGPRDAVMKLFALELPGGEEREWITPAEILGGDDEVISAEEKARRERARERNRGFTQFELSQDGARLLLTLSGRLYVVETADRRVRPLPGQGWIAPRLSPDGTAVAAVREGELHVIELSDGQVRAVTQGAGGGISHGTAEFVAQEELDRQEGFWWSPDSQHLLYQETDERDVEVRYVADAFKPESAPTEFRYPRPGQANAKVRLGCVSRQGGETTWVAWDNVRHEYLGRVTWSVQDRASVVVMNRAQNEVVLLDVDPLTGRTQGVLRETDPAWVNLDANSAMPLWSEDGSTFLWTTEREGVWQLELYSARGQRLRVLTPKDFGFHSVVSEGRYGDSIWVRAGRVPGETQLWRLRIADGSAEPVYTQPGVNEVTLGPGLWLHRWSARDGRVERTIHLPGGRTLPLQSVAETPKAWPRVEWVEGVGTRGFRAALVRPAQFISGRKYPVILSVYAGPGPLYVLPTVAAYWRDAALAEAGFIVVRIDGRGTPERGREWERAIRGDLIDVALADQVEGLQALGARFPELDLERVGVTGWSFGGYFSVMAVMKRPDVFKCAVAGAPVTFWEGYDTAYTERYLGLLPGAEEAYRRSNATTFAAQLERPLLLVHGMTDDNVYVQHSLALMEALLRAGKVAEFLPLRGTHAALADPEAGVLFQRRSIAFFRSHLGAKVIESEAVAK